MSSFYRIVFAVFLCNGFSAIHAVSADFESLFNGKDLSGWKGMEEFWSVQEGAIVGETTSDKTINANTFLVWQGGEVADFEFTAKVRFKGNNSGVQYRSEALDGRPFALRGYQMDLHPKPAYFGMLYGEQFDGRGIIATRGQKVEIESDNTVNQTDKVGNQDKLTDWEWNSIRIIAVGSRLIHQVNGVTTIDVTDHHQNALASGLLGLQLHKGPPMRVEFIDVKMRRVDATEGQNLLEAVDKTSNNSEIGKRNRSTDLRGLSVASGFTVESVYSVPKKTQGSWVSLAIDDQGRLIASDQSDKGLFRITINADDTPNVEKLPIDLSSAQGLLWKSGCLYASITGKGMFRVTDSDGDDLLDNAELLSSYFGRGEHGNHALIDSEDSEHIYALSGNHTPLPAADAISRRRVQSFKEDLLLPRQWDPRGHAAGLLAPGGWVTRFDPFTKLHDLYCVGFRNQYDAAVNAAGDLFTFDADMEWDLGLPWYRPTRICHVVSGGDFGWRSGSGKWREYYEDSLPALVNIGPGSPTGVVSGRGTKFPAKYQRALYALDWTYGRILAIHMDPHGSSYVGTAEDFISGPALPVTDAVIGADGALYFTTGGRGTRSELLRVVYTGNDSTDLATAVDVPAAAKTRRRLESFHGKVDPSAIETAWPYLSSEDRFLRHAARVAIESQPVSSWAGQVYSEVNSQTRITSAVALARMGSSEHREPLLNSLNQLISGVSFGLAEDAKHSPTNGGASRHVLPVSQQLGLLRAYELVLDRLGPLAEEQRELLIAKLDPLLPAADANVNFELLRLLVFLRAPSAASKGMQLIAERGPGQMPSWSGIEKLNVGYGKTLERIIENPPPTDAIDIAFVLRNVRNGWTPELRREYFIFLNSAAKASGGASYPGYLTNAREEALATCDDTQRVALADLTGENFNPVPDFEINPPVGPSQEWTMATALAAIRKTPAEKLDFERGRSLFHAVSCGACHRFAGLGGGVGPDLTSVPNKFTKEYLVEAIINPSKDISDQYQSSQVLVDDGRVYTGLLVEQDANTVLLHLADLAAKPVQLDRDAIEEVRPSSVSQMPAGLLNQMNAEELANLIAYMMSGGNPDHKTYQ
jgi:putative heme-binding domain-containing protein